MRTSRRLTIKLAFVCSFLIRSAGWSEESGRFPTLNDVPPPIQFSRLLQAPVGAEATWERFKGQVVVLEFWATWCGPCREAIPHLNALAEQFRGKPVQFIAVTGENVGAVESFLKRQPVDAWIGIDDLERVKESFGVEGIPKTVIINSRGMIAAITHPSLLRAEHIKEILDGKTSSLPAPRIRAETNELTATATEAAESPLFEVSIRRARRNGSDGGAICNWEVQGDRCRFQGTRATVVSALTAVFDKRAPRILTSVRLPDGLFDFRLFAPAGQADALEAQFVQAMRATFGLEVHRRFQAMEGFRLAMRSTNAPGFNRTNLRRGGGETGGGFKFDGVEFKTIVDYLENALRKPVFCETNPDGLFKISLKWEMSDREKVLHRIDPRIWQALETDPTTNGLHAVPFQILATVADVDLRSAVEEMAKPESDRFLPDADAVVRAAHEQLGFELIREKRVVEIIEVTAAHPSLNNLKLRPPAVPFN